MLPGRETEVAQQQFKGLGLEPETPSSDSSLVRPELRKGWERRERRTRRAEAHARKAASAHSQDGRGGGSSALPAFGASLSPRGPALDGGLGHVTGAGVVARSPPPRGNQLSRPGGEGARSPTGGGDMSLEDPFFVVRG